MAGLADDDEAHILIIQLSFLRRMRTFKICFSHMERKIPPQFLGNFSNIAADLLDVIGLATILGFDAMLDYIFSYIY